VLARGSATLVLSPLVATAAFMGAAILLEEPRLLYPGLPLGIAFFFLLVFFRDPDRVPGPGIVSPADGKVLEADPDTGRLTVFMALTDVHVNRAPLDGRVVDVVRTSGAHAPAYRPEARRNERVETLLETAVGPIRVAQIAGTIARRIVPYRREGDRVKKGQRIGMIRFGSRVEMTLPKRARFIVDVGDRVRAGETTVAEVVRDDRR